MAGTHLRSGAWRADCVPLTQRCRSHVFHVIDDVSDMRSWSANDKPRHNCAGEEMKWCRVWECWNYARAEICIEERELSKSVIGCSFSVGYQVYCWCLGVGADALMLDPFAAEETNCRILLGRLMMSFCYFKWLQLFHSSVCCHVFVPRILLRSLKHENMRLQLQSDGYLARSKIAGSDYFLRLVGVRLPVHMEHFGCNWTDFHKIWYLRIFSKIFRENSSLIKIR